MATRSFPEVEDEILTAVQGCYEGGTAQVGGTVAFASSSLVSSGCKGVLPSSSALTSSRHWQPPRVR
ncbi:hypothetical protein FNF31_02331 [Cafeteria roenbergensis]|uniref:Uncharacterized protein n=1 Tax=Cafeteria roenbergensis TaxID=33653 RepID=A0A5A8DBF0_CAFRO|nr:hypothetical protein FNF28_04784 [Cafeteria roenbergensis]KAA0164407.1 hypothetical protein FNF31_02331 [Cafeteria roenbergensis]